jgi:hypothetical protein
MLTTFKPNYLFNKNINDYCRKYTNESIIKITEKYTLERNKPKIQNPFDLKNNDNPNFSVSGFWVIFTISTMAFFFYNKLK